MTKEELQKILYDHKLWLADNTKGKRANLIGVDLSNANLFGANLSGANLSGADLFGADSFGADSFGAYLVGANLSNANLSYVNLSNANLSNANLSEAYLFGANLSNANLSNADLSGAYLFGADLSGTCIFTFMLGAHFGFAHFGEQYKDDGYVKIGCGGQSLVDWLENYKAIGKSNGYTNKQIKDYGDFLKYLAKRKP